MAQLPGSSQLSLSENQATIQNNRIQREINNIRQYFQSPITIAPTINGIVDYLNKISDAGERFERLVLQIYPQANARTINAKNRVTKLQTQLATLQNDYDLLYQTYEAHRTQYNIFKSRELNGRITIRTQKRRISELLLESFALRFKNRQTYHQLQDCNTDGAITTYLLNFSTNRYNKWKNRCKTIQNKWSKWKNRARNSEQLINNLNQQIFVLQNNNIANMATLTDVMSSLSPLIAQIPQYIGQEPPDEYYNKVVQVFSYRGTLAVAGFNNAVKAEILKSKMSGKYTPVLAQYPAGSKPSRS